MRAKPIFVEVTPPVVPLLVNIAEAAKRLGLHPYAVRNLKWNGLLRSVRPTKPYLFAVASLVELADKLARGEVVLPPTPKKPRKRRAA